LEFMIYASLWRYGESRLMPATKQLDTKITIFAEGGSFASP
jgi:hypothetical protein